MNDNRAAYIYALASFLSYAAWGIFNELVVKHGEAHIGLFFSGFGYLSVGIIVASFVRFKVKCSHLLWFPLWVLFYQQALADSFYCWLLTY